MKTWLTYIKEHYNGNNNEIKIFLDVLLELLEFCKNGLEILTAFPVEKYLFRSKKEIKRNLQNKSAQKSRKNKYSAVKRQYKLAK